MHSISTLFGVEAPVACGHIRYEMQFLKFSNLKSLKNLFYLISNFGSLNNNFTDPKLKKTDFFTREQLLCVLLRDVPRVRDRRARALLRLDKSLKAK